MLVKQSTQDEVRHLYSDYPYPEPMLSLAELENLDDAAVRKKAEARINQSFQKRKRAFIQRNNLQPLLDSPPDTILIGGCGTGKNTMFFARLFPDSKITAVDLTPASLTVAQAVQRVAGFTNVEYRQADLTNPDFHDGKRFDHAFSLGVIHHTPEPGLTFRNLTGALNPGGEATIFVYHLWGRSLEILLNRITLILSEGDAEKKKEIITKFSLKRRLLIPDPNPMDFIRRRNSVAKEWLPPVLYRWLNRAAARMRGIKLKKIPHHGGSMSGSWDAFAHPLVHNLDVSDIYSMVHDAGMNMKEVWWNIKHDHKDVVSRLLKDFGLDYDINSMAEQDLVQLHASLERPGYIFFRSVKRP